MIKDIKKITLVRTLILCSFLIMSGYSAKEIDSDLIIEDAYLKLPLQGSRMAAAYLRFINKGNEKVYLESLDCGAIKADFHETFINKEGNIKMRRLENLSIKAFSSLEFKPGSKHIMMSGFDKITNSELSCNIILENGKKITFSFEILNNE